jgi:uncharacterized protein (DUF4415 family)
MKHGISSRRGGLREASATRSGKRSKGKATELRTDWERLRALTDEEIEAAIAEDPEILPTTPEFWRGAKVVFPKPKKIVTMRLDADLLDWFRTSPGYQTRINSILRAYMDAQK